jgi:hypothetical protein
MCLCDKNHASAVQDTASLLRHFLPGDVASRWDVVAHIRARGGVLTLGRALENENVEVSGVVETDLADWV